MFGFSTKTWAIIAFIAFVGNGLVAYQNHSEGNINGVFLFAWLSGYCLGSWLWKMSKLEIEKKLLQK